jgi:hypothetical protein
VAVEGVLGVKGFINLDGYINSASNIIFSINKIERVRIDNAGRVGIGKSPAFSLDVNGTINGTSVAVNGASVATTGKAIAMAMVFGG